MDIQTGIDFANAWCLTQYTLQKAGDSSWDGLHARIDAELVPLYLTGADWNGDVPFSPFDDMLLPAPGASVGDALAQRVLFKAETWSAPDVGGIVRAFVSDDQTGWTARPKVVLELAVVNGAVRIITMHSPCVRCRTTTINKHGEHCTYVNRADQPCVDGLFFDGGLTFDRGELLGSQQINEPEAKWAPMMAR